MEHDNSKNVYLQNEFYLQIDIEAPRESGKMSLNNEKMRSVNVVSMLT